MGSQKTNVEKYLTNTPTTYPKAISIHEDATECIRPIGCRAENAWGILNFHFGMSVRPEGSKKGAKRMDFWVYRTDFFYPV